MTERFAVDIGGTFVDAIAIDARTDATRLEKVSTTPEEPTVGVLDAIDRLELDLADATSFTHGTTLALNALLERDGVTTGIITNAGFRDVFEVGRYDVPPEEMYNVQYERPESVVPRRRRIGVPGRMDADGDVVEPLDEDAVRDAADRLVNDFSVEAIAVCYLHAYRNPTHERRTAEILAERYPAVSVSVSSDIVREHREYERTATTVLDAYIKPIFESYVDELDDALESNGFDGSFFLTRSGGGSQPASGAKDTPVDTILSGPAGGIIGATRVADVTGDEELLAVDMGGTSLDACVIRSGAPAIEHRARLEHLPVMLPVFDIRTIGAGGGSIAWLDGELLKVGPKSAGADPGPVCYGQGGTEPTVTDAALVLGYLDPDSFLGGEMDLDDDAAEDVLTSAIAEPLGQSALTASRGIVDVAVANSVSAIREITVEKGLDPRTFTMLAYGGAGPMVVPTIARALDVDRVLIPQAPSVFSAWGMLMTDVVYDHSETLLSTLDKLDVQDLEATFESLQRLTVEELSEQGYDPGAMDLQRSFEMRYLGQDHAVDVSAEGIDSVEAIRSRFERRHERQYGYTLADPAEVVHVRVRGVGVNEKPELRTADALGDDGGVGSREAYCFAEGDVVPFEVHSRRTVLEAGTVGGPGIVQEPTSTTVFHSDQRATVDEFGHVVVSGGADE